MHTLGVIDRRVNLYLCPRGAVPPSAIIAIAVEKDCIDKVRANDHVDVAITINVFREQNIRRSPATPEPARVNDETSPCSAIAPSVGVPVAIPGDTHLRTSDNI